MVSHIIVPITGDGACLFNSHFCLMYGTEQMAREVRKLIVSHVTKNWTEFSIKSHDNNGDNYMSSAEYLADMSQLYIYGGLYELVAAGQLFHYVFEVYRNYQLYEHFVIKGYPVLRMCFTQNLSRGHFDVYLPHEPDILIPQRDSTLQQSPLSLSMMKPRKRRARYTGNIRKKQLQNAAKTYALQETPGMCCNNGKVQLPSFEHLPEPLNSLLMDRHPHHNHFMDLIRKYNGCFQMTSFGAKKIIIKGFMNTFKVQGQVCHLKAEFLEIYFVGEDEREVGLKCANFPDVKLGLVTQLQSMLHEKNSYVKQFKTTINAVQNNYRKPTNAHVGRFNSPTQNEIALVIVSHHANKLQRISEIHRAYDALQYPLMFCHGKDGTLLTYHFSSASFYAYQIMIRQDEVNHIVYFRSLFSQFLVDMYAKIETERLNFIRNHQKPLRAENYIHLKDAVGRNDVYAIDIGQMVVLPSSFTGGPFYMHEPTQDAMTYVRVHGRSNLFITFTCNPTWKDIIDALFFGQKPHDRHDIIARVFHIKVKKLMALLTKGKLSGDNRISSNIIDNVINAEMPDPEQDPLLYYIVKSNMIHGPCGSLNPNAPSTKENI
ncbi:hypothetical protein QTP88_020331 [Uroleucon formosanum]